MAEGQNPEETPKAPEPAQEQTSPVQEIVEEKIKEIVSNIPKDDPIVPEHSFAEEIGQRVDERMAEFENKINAMFLKMGGTVREGGDASPSPQVPTIEQEYVPLDKLDYTI